MTTEVMIDLETLDVGPRSVVLSVGAVLFDEDGDMPFEPFYRVLKLQSQLRRGRTVSESTLLWWMGQGEAARSEAFRRDGRVDSVSALQGLADYLKSARRVWAQGPDFDCVILASMYEGLGLKLPWKYNSVRDVRTVREASGLAQDWAPTGLDGLVPHHPVSDCVLQVATVTAARRCIMMGV